MGDLIIELSLAFLAATLIGWLSGRYLCKSGEYDERAERRRLESELATRDKDLEASQQMADGLRRQLGDQAEATALIEKERSGLRIQLDVTEGELQELLRKAQKLEVCNARHRALETELEARQGDVSELRSTCAAQADEIRDLQAHLKGTREQLRENDAESRRRQEAIEQGIKEITRLREQRAEDEARIATLQQEKSDLEQQLHLLSDEHGRCLERLEALAASVDQLHQRISERAGRREPARRVGLRS